MNNGDFFKQINTITVLETSAVPSSGNKRQGTCYTANYLTRTGLGTHSNYRLSCSLRSQRV